MNQDDPLINLLTRLISCAVATAGGLQDKVRDRRRLLVAYWYECTVHNLRDTRTIAGSRLDVAWHRRAGEITQAYLQASEQFVDSLDDATSDEALDVLKDILRVLNVIDQLTQEYDPADCDMTDGCIRRILGVLYDWENNLRIRSHVYVMSRTGEILSDDSVRKEKERVVTALETCQAQLENQIPSDFLEGN